MDHIPMNPRLWNLYVARAKAKFAGHYPSPGASHWVHEEYVKAGGRFVATDHADKETTRVSKEKYAKISKDGRRADKGK